MYVNVWSIPSCICTSLYFRFNGIDADRQNLKTEYYTMYNERAVSIYRKVKLKKLAIFSFSENYVYEVCLVPIKQQVGEKRNTVINSMTNHRILNMSNTTGPTWTTVHSASPVGSAFEWGSSCKVSISCALCCSALLVFFLVYMAIIMSVFRLSGY